MNPLETKVYGRQLGNARVKNNYWHPVGLTALVYLKEALRNERYEECLEIIKYAREAGVSEDYIQKVLSKVRGVLFLT